MVKSVLAEADDIINGQRQNDYGSPTDSFTRIGRMWAAILDIEEVSPEKVALMMAALKISRATQGFHRDSLVDLAGYAGCIELIQRDKEESSDGA